MNKDGYWIAFWYNPSDMAETTWKICDSKAQAERFIKRQRFLRASAVKHGTALGSPISMMGLSTPTDTTNEQ